MTDDTVSRFFAAIEAGDIATVRAIYSPDALIWHNDDLLEQSVDDNLKVLAGLRKAVSGLRYDVVRRAELPDGVLQQHVLRGTLANGQDVELHAAMYLGGGWPRHQDRGVPGLGPPDHDPPGPRSDEPALAPPRQPRR